MKITNTLSIKSSLSVSEYFDYRAPRYSNAIQQLPLARSLDLLPYCYIINLLKKSNLNILDAFCGTGFISNSLESLNANFILADISVGMMSGTNGNARKIVATNNFENIKQKFGDSYFDIVLSHGGFHHAIELSGTKVNIQESYNKHKEIIQNLSSLVNKDGYLIIADISNKNVPEFTNPNYPLKESISSFRHIIGDEMINFIADSLKVDPNIPVSLNDINELIDSKTFKKEPFPVPKHFFNQYIARYTKYGHKACFPDFDMIDNCIINSSNFDKVSTVYFHSPWIFDSLNQAGWFFKEKFSLFEKSKLLEDKQSEKRVYDLLEKYLGVTKTNEKIFVNWGVTYSIYKKLER